MKYEIRRLKKTTAFKPFSIIIIIESEKEYTHFHNNVAPRLTGGSHKFIGDLYKTGNMEQDDSSGII